MESKLRRCLRRGREQNAKLLSGRNRLFSLVYLTSLSRGVSYGASLHSDLAIAQSLVTSLFDCVARGVALVSL